MESELKMVLRWKVVEQEFIEEERGVDQLHLAFRGMTGSKFRLFETAARLIMFVEGRRGRGAEGRDDLQSIMVMII